MIKCLKLFKQTQDGIDWRKIISNPINKCEFSKKLLESHKEEMIGLTRNNNKSFISRDMRKDCLDIMHIPQKIVEENIFR